MVKKTVKQVQEYAMQNRIASGIIIVLLVACLGYFAYDWWRTQSQERAYNAFADSYATYQQAQNMAGNEKSREHAGEVWEEAESDFKAAQEQNSMSTYAPYFEMFEAMTLLEQGQAEEALALMNKSIDKIPASDQFAYLYGITKALVTIDHGGSTEGLTELERLANDANNPLRDMALYYLAQYYASIGDRSRVDSIRSKMQEIFGSYTTELDGKSPFLSAVEQL